MNLSVNTSPALDNFSLNKSSTPIEEKVHDMKMEAAGIKNPIKEIAENSVGKEEKTDPNHECETCKKRRYVDGSDEMVSFKSAQTVAPEAAASKVRAHEQEHVSNAYKKAAQNSGKVVRCSVAIHTSVCPECGRTYVSGGTTTTQIKYGNQKNPYEQDRKNKDAAVLPGMNMADKF